MAQYHFHLYVVEDQTDLELDDGEKLLGVIPAGATSSQAVLVTYNRQDEPIASPLPEGAP